MFKIIDSIGNPIKLPDWGGELKPGHIVKMATFKCCPVFLLGDSEKPFGVVSEADGIHASVYCGDILFQTDNFELDQTYKKGDLLYSNDCGIFTTRKEGGNALLLGMVNDEYRDDQSYIEISLI